MSEPLIFIGEQIAPLLNQLLLTVLTALFTYLGYKVKKFIEKKEIQEALNNNQELAMMSIKYVEQVGEHLASSEKLRLAKIKLIELAENQGITIQENELDVLVESALLSFKDGFSREFLAEVKGIEGEELK